MLPFDELVLNKYRIRRVDARRDGLLGRGTFGSVYLAHEELADRDVAIKELQVDASDLGAQEEEALRRFLTEGRLGLRVRHPNILEVYAIEPFEDGYLLVMELAESGDLKGLLQRGRPDLAQAVRIGIGVARGLQAAHERGVVHRDLKPGNIFLSDDGTPKVADFGVAHIPEAMGGYHSMTRTGSQPGTVIYMSPEQAQGRRVDHRSDLYSLAVILFELLTGSFYVDIERCSELARSRAKVAPALSELHFVWAFTEIAFAGPPPRPSTRNPEIPGWLDAVILRGLAREPEQRFQSGREFAEALAAGRLPAGQVAESGFDATLVDRPGLAWHAAEPTVVDLYTPRTPDAPADPAPGLPAPETPGAGSAPAGEAAVDPWAQPPESDEPVLYIAPPSWSQAAGRDLRPEAEDADNATPASPVEPLGAPPSALSAFVPAGDPGAAGGFAPRTEAALEPTPAALPSRRGHGRVWLLVSAAIVLLAVGGLAGFGLARRTPSKPVATTPAVLAGVSTDTASPAAAGSATPTATGTPVSAAATPSGVATPGAPGAATSAGSVEIATLLRPGATLIKQARAPGAAGSDAGQIAVYSQAAGSDGCQRAYIDIYRPDAGGHWVSVWDATRQPSAEKPLLPTPKLSGERCFPAVEFFDVRPLLNGGPLHVVASIIVDGDGRRRLIDLSLADATKPIALDFDLGTTPTSSPPEFTEGLPQSLRVTQNAYPAPASGVNGGYGKPIGTLDSLLRWDDGAKTFKPVSQQLTLNCSSGAISMLARAAVQVQCADGRYSAVAVNGKTAYGADTTLADLRPGDTVTLSLDPASQSPTDPLNALPVATSVLRTR